MDHDDTRPTTYHCPEGAGADVPLTDEERCFRILARPNIHEMYNLHREWKRKVQKDTGQFNSTLNIQFMKNHGWTWTEFLRSKNHHGYPTVS